MLKTIRSINWGWLIVLFGIGSILTGFKMNTEIDKGNTLLCFDSGCVEVQAYSNIIVGLFMIGIGIYMKFFRN